jgi:hypothetical protein
MEVHHHAHPDSYRDKRKKWTHYFWEFLMLFLAVFCGFLAEYKLEQTIERHREKEYILSMIEDLETDTIKINTHSRYRSDRRRRLDSLSQLLRLRDYSQNTGLIYYYARWVPRNSFFNTADRTIQQLKNAGGMRLITKKAASDAILAYDAQVKIVNTQSYSLESNNIDEFTGMMNQVFDGNVMDEMYGDSLLAKPNGNPVFLTNDKQKFNELIAQLHWIKSLNSRNIYFEHKLKLQAVNTMQVLKKEYNLK